MYWPAIKDIRQLPLLDEPVVLARASTRRKRTRKWSKTFKGYNLKESQRRQLDRQYLKPASRGWPMRQINKIVGLISSVYTFTVFVAAIVLTPCLISIYIFTTLWRSMWFKWLEGRYRHLEFVKNTTVRTAVDTKRNQGIITLLLQIKGPCQINLIKNRIQEDILERTTNGKPAFPHLKCVLTSRWARYGWVKGSEKKFNLDNHIVMANSLFKGRNVTDSNIQEYVTDIVSKMLPADIPPWQITLIPSQQDRSYLLIRLHHLYSSEDKLTLGDLLMLKQDPDFVHPSEEDLSDNTQHLLAGIFKTPLVIPQIFQHVSESLSNHWNEFKATYDPLENPSILKRKPFFSSFVTLAILSFVTAGREYYKNRDGNFKKVLLTEMEKRNVSTQLLRKSVMTSASPFNIIYSSLLLWWKWLELCLRVPRLAIKVIKDTPVYLYWLYLIHYAVQETWYIFKILYNAPRVIFEEVFLPEHPVNVHRLQTLSFCGRKVVSWSEPVPLKLVKRIRLATGASTCEIILSAAAASLRDYFQQLGWDVPEAVMTTARFMPREQLLKENSGGDPGTGMLCLPLPTQTPTHDPLACLAALQASLYHARSRQAALYLASIYRLDYGLFTTIFPTLFAKACLYLLSRRYAVTLTQIDSLSRAGDGRNVQLLWGPEVEKIMYWRPPQANVCLSLSLITYGDSIQLGVMADAQLSPNHEIISSNFSKHLHQLAASAGVHHSFSSEPMSPSM